MFSTIHRVKRITAGNSNYLDIGGTRHVFVRRITVESDNGETLELSLHADTREQLSIELVNDFQDDEHTATCMCIDCLPAPKGPEEDEGDTEEYEHGGEAVAPTPFMEVAMVGAES